MEAVKRRLMMMRCCKRGWRNPSNSTSAEVPMTTKPPQTTPQPRDSVRKTEFTSRVSGSVQTAAMPLKRLVESVISRLSVAKYPPPYDDINKDHYQHHHHHHRTTRKQPSKKSHRARQQQPTNALDKLKFCIWEGSCGWSLRRTFLLGDAQFVWAVSHAKPSVGVWESSTSTVRAGDVLETIGGVSISAFVKEEDVMALLDAAPVGTVLRFRVRGRSESCRVERVPVVVRGGLLGATIIADGTDAIPVVFRVAKETQRDGEGGGMGGIRLGDVLCEVNGQNVVGLGIAPVLEMVASCTRQMTVTFQRWTHDQCGVKCRHSGTRARRPQSTRFSFRQWLFTGGEFHDDSDDEDDNYLHPRTMRTSETKAQDGVVIAWQSGFLGLTLMNDDDAKLPVVNRLTGKGTADGIERVEHGYHLVSVNGVTTHARRFADVVCGLERMQKPLRLVFQPPEPPISLRTIPTCGRDRVATSKTTGGQTTVKQPVTITSPQSQ